MSFYIGMGIDKEHIDNIYRCVSEEDSKFLENRLKLDIEGLTNFIESEKDETEKAKAKIKLEWLKKLKLWKITKIRIEGEYKNE